MGKLQDIKEEGKGKGVMVCKIQREGENKKTIYLQNCHRVFQ